MTILHIDWSDVATIAAGVALGLVALDLLKATWRRISR